MLPPAVLAFIGKKYGNKEVNVQEYPIVSTIRFAASIAAGPPVVYTVDQTARIAFSYGENQDMAPAGRAGVLATKADTNIQNAGQTRDQADVFIYGISAWLLKSDPVLAQQVMRECDVQISTNADTVTPAGNMDAYPQPGGLFGAANSAILIPKNDVAGLQDGGPGALLSFMSNGNPTANSFRSFQNPIFWAGLSSGPDSNLQIVCTPRRTITVTSALARAAGAAGATYNGTPAVFTPATSANAFVDVRWTLHAALVKRRGVNAG